MTPPSATLRRTRNAPALPLRYSGVSTHPRGPVRAERGVTEPLLGVDVGTCPTKGVLVTAAGEVLKQHLVERKMDITHFGRAEQDADAFLARSATGLVRRDDLKTWTGETRVLEPNPDLAGRYDELCEGYKERCIATPGLVHRLQDSSKQSLQRKDHPAISPASA